MMLDYFLTLHGTKLDACCARQENMNRTKVMRSRCFTHYVHSLYDEIGVQLVVSNGAGIEVGAYRSRYRYVNATSS